MIREHLEAMERDSHGLEYPRWNHEVEYLWKRTFMQVNRMASAPQRAALEMIREPWTTYLTHYASMPAP